MAKYFGVDLSKWNSVSDYDKLAEESKFAMIRLAAGKEKDEKFMTHYIGCKKAGMYVGVYVYSLALTADEARAEAKNALELVSGLVIDYPIAFDYEDKRLIDAGLSKSRYTAVCRAFLSAIRRANYFPILYTNPDWLEYRLDKTALTRDYELWLAHWVADGKQRDYGQTMWQFGTTRIDGVNGDVDGNYAYKGFAREIREAGMNKPINYEITAKKVVPRENISGEISAVRKLGYSVTTKKL